MPTDKSSPLSRYAIAVTAVVVAIAFRYALTPLLGTTFPLATMFTAVAFTVWRAGAGPALLTTVAGWAASGYVFRGGLNYFGGMTVPEIVGFLVYLLATLPIVAIGEAMRRAQYTLEERHAELST